jgi:hypothetical protein
MDQDSIQLLMLWVLAGLSAVLGILFLFFAL